VCDAPRSVVQSLAFCKGWAATGGKSGASFEKTDDERFVIKHVKSTELDMFVHNGAKFFQHMFQVLYNGQPSLLAKYVGAYKVQMHDHVSVRLQTHTHTHIHTPRAHSLAGCRVYSSWRGCRCTVQSVAPCVAAAVHQGKKTTAFLLVLENIFMDGLSPSTLKFDLKGACPSCSLRTLCLCAVCCVLCAVCCVRSAECGVLCVVCCMLCVVCCVLVRVCVWLWLWLCMGIRMCRFARASYTIARFNVQARTARPNPAVPRVRCCLTPISCSTPAASPSSSLSSPKTCCTTPSCRTQSSSAVCRCVCAVPVLSKRCSSR
jgi:hypothetical protein